MNHRIFIAILWLLAFGTRVGIAQSIDIEVLDDSSGEGVSARLKFVLGDKRVARPRSLLMQSDWWLAEPQFSLVPKGGEFEFIVQRGHEFSDLRGGFKMEKKTRDIVTVEIPRSTDMHAENWYSGDHYASLDMASLERWQRADAVDFVVGQKPENELAQAPAAAPSSTGRGPAAKKGGTPKKQNEILAISKDPNVIGLELRQVSPLLNTHHGPVLLHGWDDETVTIEEPSNSIGPLMRHLQTLGPSTKVVPELTAPWTRDTPILLSSQRIRSMQVLSSVNRPSTDEPMVFVTGDPKEVFGRVQVSRGKERIGLPVHAPFLKEDRLRFKGGRGVGNLVEQLYWTILESGM